MKIVRMKNNDGKFIYKDQEITKEIEGFYKMKYQDSDHSKN